MSNDIIPFQDQQRMAQAIAKSGFFGLKDEIQVLALMAVAQAEGRHPASVAKDYHIIQGRPALKSDAMLARFQSAGGTVRWVKYTDEIVTGIFSHPQGGELELSWTLAQAKAIGLATKDNWKLYPRAMLRARVISEGIRAVFPAVLVGEYTPEEVGDFDAKPAPIQIKEIPQIEITDELDEPDEGDYYPFYVPNPDGSLKLYAKLENEYDWREQFKQMCQKIEKAKLSPEEKADKMYDLKAANEELLMKFDNVEK
jgi:hypothetical protein